MSERRYEVCFLNDDASQASGGIFPRFEDAQRHRDDLRSQGYEAWIEEVVPHYAEVQS